MRSVTIEIARPAGAGAAISTYLAASEPAVYEQDHGLAGTHHAMDAVWVNTRPSGWEAFPPVTPNPPVEGMPAHWDPGPGRP